MRYLFFNGPKNTTAAPVPVATGVATLKTLLQLNPLRPGRVVEWGISFDVNGTVGGAPGTVELIEVDVAATVTAFVAADISPHDGEALALNSGDPTADYIDVGTAKSGYTASAEGSITTVRNLVGPQLIAPTNQFIIQQPLGREGFFQKAKFIRIRTKFAAAANALCYLLVEF